MSNDLNVSKINSCNPISKTAHILDANKKLLRN